MRSIKRLFITALIGLTGLGTVQAEISRIDYDFNAVNISAAVDKSGVYVVQMKNDPAIAYLGDVAKYKATKPGKGQKINPNRAAVKKYVAYLDSTHDQALSSVGASNKIYSYHYALNGFAAILTTAQVKALRVRGDVVNVWRDEIRQPTTDTTPDYLGLTGGDGVWASEGKGEDVIVGIIDTGIWPEHPSFSDQEDFSNATGSSGKRTLAYGPPPGNWHGSCQSGERFSQDDCNNKLIGARYYPDGFSAHGHSGLLVSEYLSPRDSDGHGSHTASTAAGNEGPENTINGAPVSGMAPRARIAVYKVCWEPRVGDGGCAGSDSAAAIDQAVADGVDVINFSIGGSSTRFSGPDDIAFLFASAAGVFVATSNGNAGPGAQTTGTPAGVPWITAVGATQDDQVFELNLDVSGDLSDNYFALEGAGDVLFADTGNISAGMILVDDGIDVDPEGEPSSVNDGCETIINDTDIDGNIALVVRGTCSFTTKYNNAAAAGASAIIVYNDGADSGRMDPITMLASGTNIPGAMIGFVNGDLIASTISGGGSVSGLIGPGTIVSGDNRIADFSSRGPNGGAPDVIKPDVAAPGVNIIAAGAGTHSISISGTSMASPHVAGIFALLKEAHPTWSAAMAKSAVMTSARQNLQKTTGDDAADPFDIGAGHIVPAGAFEPGLVYDNGFYDHIRFLCGEPNQAGIVSDDFCALVGGPIDPSDLNLASIGVADLVGTQTVTRTVTSVTPGTVTFDAIVEAPPGTDVVVSPMQLVLAKGESVSFTVEFTPNGAAVMGEWTFGSVTWTNDAGVSDARSPIAIRPLAATDANLFTKTVDASTAAPDDTLTYELSITNGPLTGPITVTDELPTGTTFVEASETEVVTDGSTTSAWAYDGGSNSLSWTGELDLGLFDVSDNGTITDYFSLAGIGVPPFGFPSNCDDGAFLVTVPSFTYNGVSHSSVILSVNGTLEAGSASGMATSFANQEFPDTTAPNNLLAPFWRDLNGCDGGNLYVAILNSGPFEWTVYEWESIPHFGSTDAATFQVWVLNDVSPTGILPQAHFTYGRLDNTGVGATVGAEDSAGTNGATYFYNGTGTPPAVGVDLHVNSLPGGTATLGFQVSTDCSENTIVNQGDLNNGENSESAVAVTSCP